MDYYITKSTNVQKKFDVFCYIGRKRLWKISFGQNGANDYTKFKTSEEAERHKKAYITRHKKKENWGETGIKSAGWWSYHILWNKRTYVESINETAKKFEISIIISEPPAAIYYNTPKKNYYSGRPYKSKTPAKKPEVVSTEKETVFFTPKKDQSYPESFHEEKYNPTSGTPFEEQGIVKYNY